MQIVEKAINEALRLVCRVLPTRTLDYLSDVGNAELVISLTRGGLLVLFFVGSAILTDRAWRRRKEDTDWNS